MNKLLIYSYFHGFSHMSLLTHYVKMCISILLGWVVRNIEILHSRLRLVQGRNRLDITEWNLHGTRSVQNFADINIRHN